MKKIFIALTAASLLFGCSKGTINDGDMSVPEAGQDGYSLLPRTIYFDAEFTSRFITFIDDQNVEISSGASIKKVPQVGDCIFCDRGDLINAYIGKVVSVSGTRAAGGYTIELADASIEEVFEEIHIVKEFNLSSCIRGAEDDEGKPISYETAEPEMWDSLNETRLDSVARDTAVTDTAKTKAAAGQSSANPIFFLLNDSSFTGKILGEVNFYPEIHYTKSTGLSYKMKWEQKFGLVGDLHFDVVGQGVKPFGSIKIFLGQVCGIFTILKLEPSLFWDGNHKIESDIRLEIDHSQHIITNGAGEVRHICTPLKKEPRFNVGSLETEGTFGFKFNVGLNAAVFNGKLLSMDVNAYPYVSVKANLTRFSIDIPEILSADATADLSAGIGAEGYLTRMTPIGTKEHSFDLADENINTFTVNLLPVINLRPVLEGYNAKIESAAEEHSFVKSPSGGVSLWKGKKNPTVFEYYEIYGISVNPGEMEMELEADEVYYVAPYAEVDGQRIYGRMEELKINFCPDDSHVHAVDLGLSVKWACCNVGASSPEEYGGYYAWGETETKPLYDEVTYKYIHGTDANGDGWYEKGSYYDDIGEDISGTQYDVAHVKWGGSWRMPTDAEFGELRDSCDQEFTTLNGVYGRKFISRKNGNSIFLPGAGYNHKSNLYALNKGYYWSSTRDPDFIMVVWCLDFFPGGRFYYPRYDGLSVRPVSE